MPYVPGATAGVVSVQMIFPLSSVAAVGGQSENRPGGPLTGALNVHVSPDTGAPFAVASTVTVNVSPVVSARDERVIVRVKFVAVLVVSAAVAVGEGVAVARDLPGAVPLMTGPFGDVDDCLFAKLWAKVPASIPVAAQATIMNAATNSDSWECKGSLGAMLGSPSLSATRQ
jgi:hypothetical protein